MDSYCTPIVTNAKSPSSGSTSLIALGKESCTSAITLRAFKTEFPNNGKCEVTIKSPTGYGLTAVLKYAAFRPLLPCSTDRDELNIIVNKTVQHNITSSGRAEFSTDITDNDIVIRFITANLRDPVDAKGFEIYFTSYRAIDNSGNCNDGYLNCDNSRCVHNGLKCDQIDNCGNNIDEKGCDYGVSSIWLLLAISGWIFCGFNVIGIFIWLTYQKYFDFNNLH